MKSLILPSGRRSRVLEIPSYDGDLTSAYAPMSVSLRLEDHVDIWRGDMLVDPDRPPKSALKVFRAKLVWMSDSPLATTRPYLIKHTSQVVCAKIVQVVSRFDINKIAEQPASELQLNDIGLVDIETHRPLFCDTYRDNRDTGGFVVIDPATNLTVAAGMIESVHDRKPAMNYVSGHIGITVWFTGLSSAGKSTLSHAVYERLWTRGYRVELIDGDEVRRNLSRDLSFSKEDRDENIRRIGFLAELLSRNGIITLVGAISPYRAIRDEIRSKIPNFLEVFVNAPLKVCESRDVKGLYLKARAGQIRAFTGIDDPYEPPLHPDVECRTDLETIRDSADKVIEAIETRMGIPARHADADQPGNPPAALQKPPVFSPLEARGILEGQVSAKGKSEFSSAKFATVKIQFGPKPIGKHFPSSSPLGARAQEYEFAGLLDYLFVVPFRNLGQKSVSYLGQPGGETLAS